MQAPLSFHCLKEHNKDLCFLFLIEELLSFYPKVCNSLKLLGKEAQALLLLQKLFPRKGLFSPQMSALEKISYFFPLFFAEKKENYSFCLLERKLRHLVNSFSQTDQFFAQKEVFTLCKQLLCHLEKELYILFHASLFLFSTFKENENVVFYFLQKLPQLKLLPFSPLVQKLEKELACQKTKMQEKLKKRGFVTFPSFL